jgi:protein tyrosine/serine phosphatase
MGRQKLGWHGRYSPDVRTTSESIGATRGLTLTWARLVCFLLVTACATALEDGGSHDELETIAQLEPTRALAVLEGGAGPKRFAMVSSRLYRGGQPSARQLALLRALGVTRIVDLRREALGVRHAERAVARRLGMELVSHPFYGVFGAEAAFLDDVLEELAFDDGGAVYVHCKDGRERTGLVVALHRVISEGWAPELAWQREVLAHGHRPSPLLREIELTFHDHVREHDARVKAMDAGPARRRAIAAERGPAAAPRPHRAPRD